MFAISAAYFGHISLLYNHSSNFKIMTANFLGVRIFRIFIINVTQDSFTYDFNKILMIIKVGASYTTDIIQVIKLLKNL